MDQIIDNLNFTGLEELWNATFPEYQIDEYLDDLSEIDNENDLYK